MGLVVDTSTVTPGERFELWASRHRELLHPLRLQRPGDQPFVGRMRLHRVGPVEVFRIEGDASAIARTPDLIRRRDPGQLQVTLLNRGRFRIDQAGRTAVVEPGDLSGYATSAPYAVRADRPFELLLFAVPRAALGADADAVAARTATRVPRDAGPAVLASTFLRRLAAGLESGELRADAPGLGECVVDLVRTVFAGPGTGDDAPPDPSATLLAEVRAHVDAHLGDADLGPRTLAAAHHVSPRQLHRLFAREGETVAGHVRRRRLEACRRDLADPRLAGLPIAAIAAARGLADAPHFSRAFREAFATSPSAHRAARLAGGVADE